MMSFHVCGKVLESNIQIPELPSANQLKPDLTFYFSPAITAQQEFDWFQQWSFPNGEKWLSFAKTEGGYLLRFTALADFQISADGKKIYCFSGTDIPPETIRHLLLDQVVPLILSHQGHIVFHASCVVLSNGLAVAFLGESGMGKSMLTAYLTAQGAALVTDDCCLLEERKGRLWVVPSYPGLRLWPENISGIFSSEVELAVVAHYTGKKRVLFNRGNLRFCATPVPLHRVYTLSYPENSEAQEISIATIGPREAFIEVLKHSFHLDITSRQKLIDSTTKLSHLAARDIVRQLSYPRDFFLLPNVHAALLADVQK